MVPDLYDEMRVIARRLIRRHRHAGTATSIVHEAYARLSAGGTPFQSEGQFLRVAARAMRFVLVDHCRRTRAQKRVDTRALSPEYDLVDPSSHPDRPDPVLVHEILCELAEWDSRKADLVELRFFGGLSIEESADALAISLATAKRDWAFARAWMQRALGARQ